MIRQRSAAALLLLATLFAALPAFAPAFAQEPWKGPAPKELPPLSPAPVAAPFAEAPVALAAPLAAPLAVPQQEGEIVWFRTDALIWELPGSRLSIPLVTTTTNLNDQCPGAIGQPGTRVLLGGPSFSYRNDHTAGLRFTLGAWIDVGHQYGIEANGWYINRELHAFQTASDGTGNPPLYLPGFNLATNKNDSLVIADPNIAFAGEVASRAELSVLGWEANGLFNLSRGERYEWLFLAGMRYLEIGEKFQLSTYSQDLVLDQQTTTIDRFETMNRFYAGQIGTRLRLRRGRLLLDVTGKIALGFNCQTITIDGRSQLDGSDAAFRAVYPGGFYAQPTNIGSRTQGVFGVMPSCDVRLGLAILPRCIASVGYDLMYLNQTIRIGDVMDPNINLAHHPVFGDGARVPRVGPAPVRNSSDFLINGISLGLEVRY